jgi:hypothetical protein
MEPKALPALLVKQEHKVLLELKAIPVQLVQLVLPVLLAQLVLRVLLVLPVHKVLPELQVLAAEWVS